MQVKIPHAEFRRKRWYAVLDVPAEVRHIIGKARLVRSTLTGDPAEARRRVPVIIAQWKGEIAKARGQLPNPKDTFWQSMGDAYAQAQKSAWADDGAAVGVVEDILEAEALKVGDPEEGGLLYRVATGQAPKRVSLGPLVDAWKDSLRTAPKTIDQAHRDMKRMSEHFQYLDALTPQRVKVWTDKLLTEKATASTLERIGKACRGFWGYLQQSNTVQMIDPDPFNGAFKLALRVAVRNRTGRSGTSYTPEQLTALYVAALEKKDKPLADLIALGAYTGARIEELCKVTAETVKDGVIFIGKSKTAAGIRDCPIHPSVAPLVARMLKASKDGYLVPSTAENQYGNRSGPLSQRFGHLKKSLGYGPKHVFHSTRNTLITLMQRAGVSEGIAADIVGHEKKTLTYGLYGSGSAEEQKLEAISKVAYPAPLDAP